MFFPKKPCSANISHVFLKKKFFLYFGNGSFRPQSSKFFPLKKFLIFFPTKNQSWKNFLYFFKKSFYYISWNGTFRPQDYQISGGNFSALRLNKFLHFLQKKAFLIFREIELSKKDFSYFGKWNFLSSKNEKARSENISYEKV